LVREKVEVKGSTMTHENMSLFDAIHSQRAVRHFSDQPVSDEAVETILNAAICAPNGGNRQLWRFIVIRDAEIKRWLGQWYLAAARVDPKARDRRKAMPMTTASPRRLRSHPASAGLCQLVDHPACAMT
jgi:nitroreductase